MLRMSLGLSALLAGAASFTSCTFLFDEERGQCESHADCAQLLGADTPSLCNADSGLCEAVPCTDDTHCAPAESCNGDNECEPVGGDGDADDCVDCAQAAECEADEQCVAGSRCMEGACVVDPLWGCAGQPYDPPTAQPNFTYQLEVLDVLSDRDVTAMAEAVACRVNDFGCMRPTATGTFGDIERTLTLPFQNIGADGFVGFIRLTSPDFIDSYFHVVDPFVANVVSQDRIRVFNEATYSATAGIVGVELDPDLATMIVLVYNCQGQLASDVSMLVAGSEKSSFFAIENEMTPLPSRSTTGKDGTAIIVNVEPGLREILFAYEPEPGVRTELDRASLFAREKALNYLHWYPTHAAFDLAQQRVAGAD